jgi:glycosyltransferase involved in cell wall biosynthesis
LRILMLSDVYFPRINGVSTSIRTFRRELHSLGHEVTLVVPDYGLGVEADDPGLLRIPARRLPLDPEDRMMRRRPLRELRARLAERQYDILHIQTPFVAHYAGLRLADALGLPRVESYHTFFEEYLFHYLPLVPDAWMRYLARRFTRSQCKQVDALVMPSNAMLEVLRGYGVETPAQVVPTGLDGLEFRGGDGAAFRRRHGIPADRPVLVHVGRVAFEKNIDFLLRVLARVRRTIPEVLLVVAGEGPAMGHLQRLGRHLSLEDNLLFVGYLRRDGELLDCYRAGDAFVFASRTETQGLVLLEAMALGVPVVSTAVMGTWDIVAPERGTLCAAEEPDAFAARVLALLQDPALAARLRREGPVFAGSWSSLALARRLLDFYREVIERRLPAALAGT